MYETPQNIAVINNSVSRYIWGDIPTREIDQAINWLNTVKADCDFKIDQLVKVKKDRQRSQEWRDNLKALADDFAARDFVDVSLDDIRLEVDKRYHNQYWITEAHKAQIAKYVHRNAIEESLRLRNIRIALKRQNGVSVAKIAKEYDLSRQQIYDILSKTKL